MRWKLRLAGFLALALGLGVVLAFLTNQPADSANPPTPVNTPETIATVTSSLARDYSISMPDLDIIPIYSAPTVVEAECYDAKGCTQFTAGASYKMSYTTPADVQSVIDFYADALNKNGWHNSLVDSKGLQMAAIYVDPSGQSPWGADLGVMMWSVPPNLTWVQLNYVRRASVLKGLPVYPDALNVVQTSADSIEIVPDERKHEQQPMAVPVRTITKSYTTKATLSEVERFYNENMPNFGWWYYDVVFASQGRRLAQNSFASSGGLYFWCQGVNQQRTRLTNNHLYITATPGQAGQTKIELKAYIVEIQPSPERTPSVK